MWLLHRVAFWIGACSLPLAGCGKSVDPNRLPTYPATVTVKYKGEPVEGAVVTFVNEQAPAYGRTDEKGVAKMKTYEEGDGAVAAIHAVTIAKMQSESAPAAPIDSPEYDPNIAPEKITYFVPQKYGSPATSGLVAEVKESSPNEFTFELVD